MDISAQKPVQINSPSRAVSPQARRTFAGLRRMARGRGVVERTQDRIAEALGCTARTVRTHLAELEAAGWVERQPQPLARGGSRPDRVVLTSRALPRVSASVSASDPLRRPRRFSGSIHILSDDKERSSEHEDLSLSLRYATREGRDRAADRAPRRLRAVACPAPSQPTLFARTTPTKTRQRSEREREFDAFREAYAARWGEPYAVGGKPGWLLAMRALRLVAEREPDAERRALLLAEYAALDDPWLCRRGHRLMTLLSDATWVRVGRLADDELRERARLRAEAEAAERQRREAAERAARPPVDRAETREAFARIMRQLRGW